MMVLVVLIWGFYAADDVPPLPAALVRRGATALLCRPRPQRTGQRRRPFKVTQSDLCRLRWRMDALTIFGLVAVTAMLVFYALEDRSPHYVLAFAVACGLASFYGFLQGAWPFGVVELIWAGVAVQRWRQRVA
jgi:hypothetical protein